ncbi:hypothetical protein AVEN_84228-1 [Araneus ventricosus]|uniref:Endonuclease/exonuclease/phosphatase domain-containing protein n=1 Tax=Araneus ventricosus TaxID=182803 RepID=A0A4Y2L179_ARAVE|nr:hypothetical protein AVEN_84228-1 [Araneus ventricosus]
MLVRHLSDHIVAVDLAVGNACVTVVSFHFPTSLNQTRLVWELEGVLDLLQTRNILIAGDANVRSTLWGPELPDHRPQDEGGPLIELILARNLLIWNNSDSLSTFETERGKSWIDVTLSSQSLYHRKGNWDVHRTILSDNNPITFTINGITCAPPGRSCLSQRQRLKLAKATKNSFSRFNQKWRTSRPRRSWNIGSSGLICLLNKQVLFVFHGTCQGLNPPVGQRTGDTA